MFGLKHSYTASCGRWGWCAWTYGPTSSSITPSISFLISVKDTSTLPVIEKIVKRHKRGEGVIDLPPFESRGIMPL